MAGALMELEQKILSKQVKLTSQEANVLLTFQGKFVRDIAVGAVAGGGIAWLATRTLSNFFRINLSGGAAVLSAFWKFSRSVDSCVEHILGLEGSRMQKELTNIMLKKYQDDPLTMQFISKHLYSEKVFDDSSSDQLKLRWRYRNFSGDNVTHSERPHDRDSYGDYANSEPKQVSMNSGGEALANPFDCVFGVPPRLEEIHLPDSSSKLPRRHNRSHKRSHRRYRLQNHEVSLKSRLSLADDA